MSRGLRHTVHAAALGTVLAACGGPSAPAPIPQPPPLQISCPAPITINDAQGAMHVVTFTNPTAFGGASPVGVTCSPPSGSDFALGDTTVRCTATDGRGRQAGCSFSVSVRHRQLAITRILAFGDSMTEGENGRPAFVDLPNAYPTLLQQMFMARIPGQSITVFNEGMGGERVTENDGRLKDRIGLRQPQVLLLLEGMNDLAGGVSPSRVAAAIGNSIDTARDRGVQYVFVSTLLPTSTQNCQPSGVPRCRGNDIPVPLIVETNQMIRSDVPATGAYLVDPYGEFVANGATFIDTDGLHLRPEGNRALASAFWERLIQVVPAPQLTGMATSDTFLRQR